MKCGDGRPIKEDGRPKTGVRSKRTEDRRPKKEDGRPVSEDQGGGNGVHRSETQPGFHYIGNLFMVYNHCYFILRLNATNIFIRANASSYCSLNSFSDTYFLLNALCKQVTTSANERMA